MSPWLSDLLLRTQTDERLVALARLGNQRAEEMIVARYREALLLYARRISPDRAEDLVQQTLLSALSALRSGTEVRHLRGWLYEILRHLAWRESAAAPLAADLVEANPVTESVQQVAERRMLALDTLVAMAALPASQQDALVQTAVQGRSRAEVADIMGLSEGAVRQLVHRARAAVRASVTAVIPLPLVRWLANSRAGSAAGLSETALGAGAASGVGLAFKVGVGAVVASGVLAAGVITGASPHTARRHATAPLRAGVATPGTGPAAASQGNTQGPARPILVAARDAASTQSGPNRSGPGRRGASLVSVGGSVSGDALASTGRRGPGGGGSNSGPGTRSPSPGSGSGTSQGSDGGRGPSNSGGGDGSGDGGGSGSSSGGGGGSTSGGSDGGGGSGGGSDGGGGSGSGSDGGSSGSGSSGGGGGTSTSGSAGGGGGTSTSGSAGGGGGTSTSGSDGGGGTSTSGSDGGGGGQPTVSGSSSGDGSSGTAVSVDGGGGPSSGDGGSSSIDGGGGG